MTPHSPAATRVIDRALAQDPELFDATVAFVVQRNGQRCVALEELDGFVSIEPLPLAPIVERVRRAGADTTPLAALAPNEYTVVVFAEGRIVIRLMALVASPLAQTAPGGSA